MIEYVIFFITLIGLIMGSITDIQRREVPDWISYGMVFSALALRFMYSVVTMQWSYFLYGLLGFGILFGLAYLMFYTGQWGGGDSKVLIAMGALFATFPEFLQKMFNPFFGGFPFLIAFWINLLLVGAIYAIVWSIVVGIFHYKDFMKTFKEKLAHKGLEKVKHFIYIFSGAIVLSAFFFSDWIARMAIVFIGFLLLSTYFVWIAIKSIEESCMYQKVKPEELTEGDWVVKDIIIDNKFICGPKTLGVELKHIRKLKELYKEKKIDKIIIKTGIPFIPSFLVAFIITCVWGNFIIAFIV